MVDLTLIVPTRGRPQAVGHLADAFSLTCTSRTELVIAVDSDDPDLTRYAQAVTEAQEVFARTVLLVQDAPGSMAAALNAATLTTLDHGPAKAIGFMGDDHRPRTRSWDTAYLAALETTPGIVYGNDLIHGKGLPTQFAVSRPIVEALGFLSPPGLKHMYIDNYWRDIGQAAGCLTYLDAVVVEHMHPVAAKAENDEGYQRVNAPEVYAHDAAVYEAHMRDFQERDVRLIRQATAR